MTPTELARACADSMLNGDRAVASLGITLEAVGPGTARMAMPVAAHMVNGHGMCHGGYIFALADSAFAFACNSFNERAVAAQCSITFLRPAQQGETLVATAERRADAGRTGLYDARVTTTDGTVIAEFRGHSRTLGEPLLRCALTSRPDPAILDPIEHGRPRRADGAATVQRLGWTLHHAYQNVPHYRAGIRCTAGVHPDDFRQMEDLAALPVHHQGGFARQLPVRLVRRAAGPHRAHPRQLRHNRQANGGGLHQGRPGWYGRNRDGTQHPRLPAGGPGNRVHVAYGYGLFTGGLGAHYGAEELGCAVIPMGGGQTDRQVQLIADFQPDIIMVTPSATCWPSWTASAPRAWTRAPPA